MKARTMSSLRRGVEAGLVASVPQVVVPQIEERLLDLPRGTASLGPRFIEQLARRARRRVAEDEKWLAASSFHFGYAALWGALYALAYERRPIPPWIGGALLSAGIWAITFPRWGGAVRTGTELPPRHRSWQREVVLTTAPVLFGLGTALLYGRGPKRGAAV